MPYTSQIQNRKLKSYSLDGLSFGLLLFVLAIMKSITELERERLVYHNRYNAQNNPPIYRIHRFSVFKLKIIKRLYSQDYGETNFLILDEQNPVEKCIVYAIFIKPNVLHKIKYWRAVNMDKELTGYLISGFMQNYLKSKYVVVDELKI